MIRRLVWNFEFVNANPIEFAKLNTLQEDALKWEARVFWPETDIIQLNLIDTNLLQLQHYQYKQKIDLYHLVPEKDHNIKSRRGELFYKPLIKKNKYACGYGTKLNLSTLSTSPSTLKIPELMAITAELQHTPGLQIEKDSFIYKFSSQPAIRLELSRIQIHQTIYFSLCVEGRSRHAVETITTCLLGETVSSDYVSFLKKIMNNK
jgi:hypothetical protein